MITRIAALAVAVLVLGACGPKGEATPKQSFSDVPVAPLEELFVPIGVVTLRQSSSDPIGFAAGLAILGPQAYLADPRQGNVKVFGVGDGALLRVLGRTGDGPGEFRRPVAATVDRHGAISIWDVRRHALTTWDSNGTFLHERVLAGEFSKVIAMPDADRFLLPGWARGDSLAMGGGSPSRSMAHEVDSSGAVVASYSRYQWPTHPWAGVFSTPTSTRVGAVVVSGTMGSNQLSFRNRESGREWTSPVGAPWYAPPAWPSPSEAEAAPPEAMMKWRGQQQMLIELFGLPAGRVLAEFQSSDSTGRQLYSYIIADTTGRSLQSSLATPIHILAVQDSVLFGVNTESDDGSVTLHRMVLR